MLPVTSSKLQRYGVAVLVVAIALLLKLLLTNVIPQEKPFLLFFAAIMVSAWYGGRGAGVLATTLAAVVSDYFFIKPTATFLGKSLGQNFELGLFVLEGLAIALVIAQLQIAKQEAQHYAQSLQQNQAKLNRLQEALLNSIPALVYFKDQDSKYIAVNQKFAEITNTPLTEIPGKTDFELFPAQEATAFRQDDQEVITSGQPKGSIEEPVTSADGNKMWTATYKTPYRNQHGEITGLVGITIDISARQRTEEALRQSEVRFRTLVEQSPLSIQIVAPDGKTIEVNQAWEKLWGLKLADLENYNLLEDQQLVAKGLMPYIKKAFAGVPSAMPPVMYDAQLTLCKGQQRWVQVYIYPVKDEVGNIREVVLMDQDITERKRAEVALKQSEERYRSLVVATSQIVWTTQAEGQVVDMPEWRAYTGQSQEDVKGWGWLQALHPEDRDRTAQTWANAVATKSLYETEYRIRGADGNYRHFCARGVPVMEEEGSIREWVGICTDITERKLAEEQIRNYTTRLQILSEVSRAFAEATPNFEALLDTVSQRIGSLIGDSCVIRLLSDDGQWLELVGVYHPNPEATAMIREMLSASPQRIDEGLTSHVIRSGQPLLIPVVSPEQLRASLKPEYLPYLDHFSIHSILVTPLSVQGRIIGALHISRIDPGCPYTTDDQIFLQDLADRAALAIDNARLYKQAQEANRVKDDFVAIVSHELRTPINVILGWATLLRTRKFSEAKIAEVLKIIDRNAKLQTELIEDLLDISRLMRGQLRLHLSPVNLVPIIKLAIASILPTAEEKAIHLESVLEPSVAIVSGDPERLQQIICNLVSNAIKFTPAGGRVEVRLWFSSESSLLSSELNSSHSALKSQNSALIQVSDTGKGISPEFLPHVFDRFRQAEKATTRKYGGLGLGLAIVRELVELHGGTVSAYSAGEERGATLTVKLPLLPESRGAGETIRQGDNLYIHTPWQLDNSAPGQLSTSPTLSLSGLDVMVVDDEADNLEVITTGLEQFGATVTAVTSAEEARNALALGSQPAVLISDIGMPGEDGRSLIRSLREQGIQIPAVALTAYAREQDREQALLAGFQMHLAKPIAPAQLAAVVARLAGISC